MSSRLLGAALIGCILASICLVALSPQSSKQADIGVALVTGLVVSLAIFKLEESRRESESTLQALRQAERDREEAKHRAERISDAKKRDSDTQRLLIQQLVVSQAKIVGMDLSDSDVSGLFFTNKSLESVRFERATAVNSDFAYAELTGVSFRSAGLSDANFRGATCIGCDFSGATLTSASLDGASFVECSFVASRSTGATLEGAKFERCEGVIEP